MRTAVFGLGIVVLSIVSLGVKTASAAALQEGVRSESCEARGGDRDGRSEVAAARRQTLAQASLDRVQASPNGGVKIHGADRADVLVEACIHATAATEEEAKQLASQVQIVKGPGEIEPTGPHNDHERHWSVSYEIWLPTHSSLEVTTVNGGIHVEHVEGNIKINDVNGGLHLDSLAGEVRASTVNGGVTVLLSGATWKGSGLEINTTNGGVRFEVPSGYGARVEASTVNGGVHCDFPVTVQGSMTKHVSFQLGGGGPEIRTSTVNGGIRFNRGA